MKRLQYSFSPGTGDAGEVLGLCLDVDEEGQDRGFDWEILAVN